MLSECLGEAYKYVGCDQRVFTDKAVNETLTSLLAQQELPENKICLGGKSLHQGRLINITQLS